MRRRGNGGRVGGPEGREAEVRGAVAHENEHYEGRQQQHGQHEFKRAAPAQRLAQTSEQRQENKLARRRTRCQQAHDKTAPGRKPARRNSRAQHHRRQTGAHADDDAPEQEELPQRRHPERTENASSNQHQRHRRDAPDAEPVHEGGRERSEQPKKHETDREGRQDVRGGPAELGLQRPHQDTRRAHSAGRHQHRQKGDAGDHPSVVDASTAEEFGRRVFRRRC